MIINLTPHTVTVLNPDNTVKQSFESVGVARAEQHMVECGELEGIRLVRMEFGPPVGLPDPSDGTYYIVSAITIDAARKHGRALWDLFYVADTVRDEHGHIAGCRALNPALR